MNRELSEEIRVNALPKKRCYRIRSNVLIAIDKSIVAKLAIDPSHTIFEQEITKEGILMRMKRIQRLYENDITE